MSGQPLNMRDQLLQDCLVPSFNGSSYDLRQLWMRCECIHQQCHLSLLLAAMSAHVHTADHHTRQQTNSQNPVKRLFKKDMPPQTAV